MDVSTHGHRSGDRLDIGLLQEKVAHIVTEFLEDGKRAKKRGGCRTQDFGTGLRATL